MYMPTYKYLKASLPVLIAPNDRNCRNSFKLRDSIPGGHVHVAGGDSSRVCFFFFYVPQTEC